LLLHHGPAHGYTMIEGLVEFGLANPHPRVVYRVLRNMETNEWVASTWDAEETQGPPRRVYRLTALGNEMLRACIQALERTRGQIDGLIDTYRQHMEGGEGEHHASVDGLG
jgi:DNA-binding PadR family transcriptional regulator